jgi:hypothetical protein
VVGVFGKGLFETINLFQANAICEVFHAAAAILDRPHFGFARLFSHGENFISGTGRHRDAEVDGAMCRKLAPFSVEALVMIETGRVIGTFANFALDAEIQTGHHMVFGSRGRQVEAARYEGQAVTVDANQRVLLGLDTNGDGRPSPCIYEE